ncbi:S1 family peptidase [Saccharopolyspora elongata]|uniref:S1 family peptidase n=1 Tax=Saccharopolyspora elongata TaxID=2530387 RepID=UPI0014051BEF|nr:serine protease [Saccharopolyspora elongata]
MKKSITFAAVVLASAFALSSVAAADEPAPNLPHTSPRAVEPLIVGGTPASSDQGTASLSLEGRGMFCSATIVGSEWAVAAAHCAYFLADPAHPPKPVEQMRLRYGSVRHADGGREVAVKAVFPHEGWNWGQDASPADDIALFQLAEPVHGVQPVRVTPIPVRPETEVRVLGWGSTQPDGQGEPSEQLMRLDTRTTEPGACAADSMFRDGFDLCIANLPESGMCFGDSGGPTLQHRWGRWELVGVNSRGTNESGPLPCGGRPDVATAVGSYWPWMVRTTAQAGAPLVRS